MIVAQLPGSSVAPDSHQVALRRRMRDTIPFGMGRMSAAEDEWT